MTRIWKETGFVEDDNWVVETELVKAGEGQRVLLPLSDFLTVVEESNEAGFGVLIQPADDVMRLAPYLDRIAVVAVAFPAFNDGRAFSHAALLRQRLGFSGEVRAVGDVLIDQVPLMLRTGIDSFAVRNAVALRRLEQNDLRGIAQHYQPSSVSGAKSGGYSWRRVG